MIGVYFERVFEGVSEGVNISWEGVRWVIERCFQKSKGKV